MNRYSGKRIRASLVASGLAAVAVLGLTACGTEAEQSLSDTTVNSEETTDDSTTMDASDLTGGTVTVDVEGTSITYTAAYIIDGVDAVIDGGTYEAAESDEAVFLVINGGSLTISDATLTKTGDAASSDANRPEDVSDDYNFYGMNSAVVVVGDDSTVSIDDSTIDVDASGANAVIAVDQGEATVTDTTITTDGNSSRGLHATYEGVIAGENLTISTTGAHSAAVATDRGSGTVTVTGENFFTTEGDGSPLVYSTGSITVSGVTGTSANSEVIVIEGKNTATMTDSDVTAGGGHAIQIYQSMSGDAADADAAHSVGAVTLEDTSIAFTGDGSVFYFTNTTGELTITNVSLTTQQATLISADEDRWGTSGSNGADATVTISGSQFTGDVAAGSSSSIAVTLGSGAAISGATSGAVTVS